ncbi:four helix bundle protein [Chryseobacterium taklimakanense]|uniref:Four helix bundle protein n=1 Tax=Chryseobacterium taklimakanense TaxID=536441 RepID=A0A239X1V4_9FLAO|nr:four helix bundle protein [Chryseobacterium taklimakanense]SNV40695.1 four helix bundle protein [Chryseobacterium taklimakanense]
MSYRNLDIYKISLNLFIKTHPASLKLPKYELYELGSQLRRSSDSVVSNIIEGYGRSVYKKEYERFLVFCHSSCDETIGHLEKIMILYPNLKPEFEELHNDYNLLGGKINNYLKWVRENWNKGKDEN